MRKLIVASVIFLLLVICAITEIIYTTNLYTNLYDGLVEVSVSMEQNKQKLDNPKTIKLIDDVVNTWKKGREVVFCLGNHTVLRNIDEKIISLEAMIKTNHTDDSFVTIEVCLSLVEAIKNDSIPVWSNLF